MIVVTGGAGFIGSYFLRKLNEQGITDITVVDVLRSAAKWKNLVGKQFSEIVSKEEFRRRILAEESGAEIEAIFHFGACSSTTETDADYLLDNNYAYSRDLALFAVKRGLRFIYASSGATYGAGENSYSDDVFDDLRPLNMYGYSKHLFDLWVRRHGFDSQFVGIKFFNVFGPNEYHKADMASMVYKSYHQVMQTGKIRLFKSYRSEYADGEQQRDFVYAGDAAEVIWRIWQEPSIAGIFNLGTGKARTWNDLAASVFHALDRPVEIEYYDMPEALKGQYQYYTKADVSKLQASPANVQFRELEDSVRDYVQNYLHPERRYH